MDVFDCGGVKEMANINQEIKKIGGVEDCHYDFESLSLSVYYDRMANLENIKIRVQAYITGKALDRAIEKVKFYSM